MQEREAKYGRYKIKYRCKRCQASEAVPIKNPERVPKSKKCPFCNGRMRVEGPAVEIKDATI